MKYHEIKIDQIVELRVYPIKHNLICYMEVGDKVAWGKSTSSSSSQIICLTEPQQPGLES